MYATTLEDFDQQQQHVSSEVWSFLSSTLTLLMLAMDQLIDVSLPAVGYR
jgi:hypothetical protein